MKQISILILLILLNGCAIQYQKKSSWDGGYSETQLDENIFRVSFVSNEFTDEERTVDFTLLRSAELTIEHGYRYFAVIDGKSSIKTDTYSVPATYQTYSNGFGGSTTYTYGGGIYSSSTPSASNTIMMFKEKPQGAIAYNAEFVAKNIREKYEME